jgi:hypothetical protein
MTILQPDRQSARSHLLLLVTAAFTAACAAKKPPTLSALCTGRGATARVAAAIDTVRSLAGPALVTMKGSRFEMRFDFAPRADSANRGARDCNESHGTAAFTGTIPERVRLAAAADGEATWRVAGDSVLLDLNPGTRDNNVFVVLPLDGGRGHWGLSTFTGEVAGGTTTAIR